MNKCFQAAELVPQGPSYTSLSTQLCHDDDARDDGVHDDVHDDGVHGEFLSHHGHHTFPSSPPEHQDRTNTNVVILFWSRWLVGLI